GKKSRNDKSSGPSSSEDSEGSSDDSSTSSTSSSGGSGSDSSGEGVRDGRKRPFAEDLKHAQPEEELVRVISNPPDDLKFVQSFSPPRRKPAASTSQTAYGSLAGKNFTSGGSKPSNLFSTRNTGTGQASSRGSLSSSNSKKDSLSSPSAVSKKSWPSRAKKSFFTSSVFSSSKNKPKLVTELVEGVMSADNAFTPRNSKSAKADAKRAFKMIKPDGGARSRDDVDEINEVTIKNSSEEEEFLNPARTPGPATTLVKSEQQFKEPSTSLPVGLRSRAGVDHIPVSQHETESYATRNNLSKRDAARMLMDEQT
ncbi:unnamed protein product, partial [Amoebophrya sp. A120]